jgi:hypothetical protein
MNFFTELFKKSFKPPPSIEMLTDKSPLHEVPEAAAISLWTHQLAMIKRCIDIEEYEYKMELVPSNMERYTEASKPNILKPAIGIMNDPPGCGKTYVALSLMALDKNKTVNIVVVPPNLHHQWIDAVNKFLPKDFLVKTITEYSEIMNICDRKSVIKFLKDVRLIVITTTYVDAFASIISNSDVNIERTIVDEIDTVVSLFHNIPPSKRVWFMSASFDSKNHKKIGPFNLNSLSEEQLGRIICRCDHSFMITSQPPRFEEPLTDIITIPDGYLSVLKEFVDEHAMILLNALNLQKAKINILRKRETMITDVKQLAEAYLSELKEDILRIELRIKDLDQDPGQDPEDPEDPEAEINKLNKDLAIMKAKQELFEKKVQEVDVNITKTKIKALTDIFTNIHKQTDCKWLFFSDDFAIFDKIENMLTDIGIKFVMLNQGTDKKNEQAILDYKRDPNIRVAILNSMKDGCGLNLENTTNILFLHRTNPTLVEQVIGRVQRPGQKSRLKILCLYHENELKS